MFKVGDTIYKPVAYWSPRDVQCPDCLGSRKWYAEIPKGGPTHIPCPTCARGYAGSTGTVQEWDDYGRVQVFRVDEVRRVENREGVYGEYRCTDIENGGNCYLLSDKDDSLFSDRESAALLLPSLVEKARSGREKANAERVKDKRSKAGGMVAYYRKEIRDAKKRLKSAEAGLKRISES